MSLTFRQTMDPHAESVYPNAKDADRFENVIGSIQWHPSRPPRFVVWNGTEAVSLSDLKEIVERLDTRIRPVETKEERQEP